MSEPRSGLEVAIRHRVHHGLTLDVRLAIGPEVVALVGPSGSGKTALVRLIAGLDRFDSGRVALDGVALADTDARAWVPLRERRIGLVFQDDLLFPHLSVARNVTFGLRGPDRRDARRRLAEVADLCGIADLLGRRPATLSGGERQRVGLARALAPRPRLLLGDEPFSALDLEARLDLIARLRDHHQARPIPWLAITHAPAEVHALGGRVFRLADGHLLSAVGPVDHRVPSHPTVNRFAATVVGHDGGRLVVELADGARVTVGGPGRPRLGALVTVALPADAILLARPELTGAAAAARNRLPGRVERVEPGMGPGGDDLVVVQAGDLAWSVAAEAGTATRLGLLAGSEVLMMFGAVGGVPGNPDGD